VDGGAGPGDLGFVIGDGGGERGSGSGNISRHFSLADCKRWPNRRIVKECCLTPDHYKTCWFFLQLLRTICQLIT